MERPRGWGYGFACPLSGDLKKAGFVLDGTQPSSNELFGYGLRLS